MVWILSIIGAIGFASIYGYYIIYPGGKKNWEKRKKEIEKHLGNSETLEDELHDE